MATRKKATKKAPKKTAAKKPAVKKVPKKKLLKRRIAEPSEEFAFLIAYAAQPEPRSLLAFSGFTGLDARELVEIAENNKWVKRLKDLDLEESLKVLARSAEHKNENALKAQAIRQEIIATAIEVTHSEFKKMLAMSKNAPENPEIKGVKELVFSPKDTFALFDKAIGKSLVDNGEPETILSVKDSPEGVTFLPRPPMWKEPDS